MLKYVTMSRVSISIITCIGILSGCSWQEQPADIFAKYNVEFNPSDAKELKAPLFNDCIHRIALETTSDCLIGDISKVYFISDSLIVFDQKHNNIFLFDQKGKFLKQIGVKGQGPEEYNMFNDVVYDKHTDRIYAFERFRNRMYVYKKNGTLERIIKSEFCFNSFMKNEHGYWIYSCFKQNNPQNHLLMLIDDSLSHIKEQYFPQSEITHTHFTSRFTESSDGGSLYFYHDGSNIIWELTDKASPFLGVDFKEYTLPYYKMKQAKNLESYDKLVHTDRYIGFMENVHISNELIIFNCRENGMYKNVSTYQVLYNLKTHQHNLYDCIIQSRESVPISVSSLIGITDTNRLVYTVSPQRLDTFEFEQLKKIMPNISEDDNPILMLIPY